MLGYSSIQKTAHCLEDSFKILKESPIAVDQKLESLFLKGYDVLQDLVEKLQSPMGLQPDEADAIVDGVGHQFEELQNYLTYLKKHGSDESAAQDASKYATQTLFPEEGTGDIENDVKTILRKMLQVFRQEPTAANRKKLHRGTM